MPGLKDEIMNYWIITDTHFGHTKMQEYCGRPKEFENKIIKNTLSACKPGDVLIHLGDICIGDDEKWHNLFTRHISAKRWLIRGNHDKKSSGWYMSHGWDCVADELLLDIFGKRILFSHRPATIGIFNLNIHGHHHNTGHHPEDETTSKHCLVFIEHEYSPISLRKIVESR